MIYNGAIKTTDSQQLTADNDFHLMRGRVNVDGHRGYYIIHPESSANPPCLNATSNGQTAVASWNIAKSATTQRWLIMTAEEALNFENGNILLARKELADLLAKIRELAQTPHREDVEAADATLSNALANIENKAENCTKGEEITILEEQARTDAITFLSSVSATDMEKPFDLTFMIENPNFDNSATTGWTSTNDALGYDAQGVEFYEKKFDFYQVLANMPSGYYTLHANAFQRPGAADAIYTPYKRGSASITTSLYIGSTSAPVKHICDDRQPSALFNDGGWGSDKQIADGTYIPNCMVGAEKYFVKGLYDSSVSAQLEKAGSSLRIGIKCDSAPELFWTMFDSFRLYFFGGNNTPVSIREITDKNLRTAHSLFDLQGRKISPNTKLKSGIYVVGGKKVIIK